jgi:hypothetical protein
METSRISFGDGVRIRFTETTETLGIAGQMAIVNGRTPSVTGVEVIGTSSKDLAIAVTLEGQTKQLWFADEVLEFVDGLGLGGLGLGWFCFWVEQRFSAALKHITVRLQPQRYLRGLSPNPRQYLYAGLKACSALDGRSPQTTWG